MKIGYQGIEGSNSEEVAKRFIEKMQIDNAILIPLISSENVVKELNNSNIDYGIMALKNSLVGIVEETQIALQNTNFILVSEDKMHIHHCLFISQNASVNEINIIASHIQALKQTKQTRKKIFSNCTELDMEDTAIAAKYLSIGKLKSNVAVICRKNAGEMFGLKLIYEDIEDDKENFTTFGIYKLKNK